MKKSVILIILIILSQQIKPTETVFTFHNTKTKYSIYPPTKNFSATPVVVLPAMAHPASSRC